MERFSYLRCVLLVIGAIGTVGIPTVATCAATQEEQSVLAPVKAMFDGMTKRDAAAIKEPLLLGGTTY